MQEQVQKSADERRAARNDLDMIMRSLEHAERAGPYTDEPEGIRTITVSDTLAKQWIESLKRALKTL